VIIITGPIGSGKTTLLKSLLQFRPCDEKWAFLINDVGVATVESSSDVEVRVVHGACMSGMKTGLPVRSALLQMLKRPRPQFLFIELSTIGEPNRLRATLQQEFGEVAVVHAVVALVPLAAHSTLLEANPAYRPQLEQADVLIVNESTGSVEQAADEPAASDPLQSQVAFDKPQVLWPHEEAGGLPDEVVKAVLLST